ncbi:MAG: rRNA maturation RNase YbeY [Niabella sp.]
MRLKNFIIQFHFQKQAAFKNKTLLKHFIAAKLEKAGKKSAGINYVFCSDEELLEINKTHLNHDFYTDIITFDLSEKKSGFLLSDIYISIDRIRDNAKTLKIPVNTELHRVIFHGVLHLIGYKDKTEKDEKLMRKMEENWLAEYNYSLVHENS